MKKKILFLIILFLPNIVFGQWTGDGLSSSTAFYGKINSSNTMTDWTITNYPGGIVYVGRSAVNQYDLEIEASGSLTIGPGITVKFCSTESDLRITGTGILSAIGNSTSSIIFTKDSQVSWGHISFEGSTGSSSIKYCTIEFGLKSGNDVEGYGGGIYVNTSNLAIENSYFHDNSAVAGGAIFVDKNQNPSIKNTLFYSNTASEVGGGIFLWDGSSSTIESCIFDSNHAQGTSFDFYTGGGLCAMSNCTITVVNCTFANNTSARTLGQGIQLYYSSNSQIINSVFWGSNNQTYLSGTYTINNSAFQGSNISGTGNINLASSNVDPAGPNFINPATNNWSIKVISPCRDAGTTPSPAILTDYIGNSRIGAYDIGAYEVQYNGWKTTASSTAWGTSGNWVQGVPVDNIQNIVIPTGASNYPNITTSQDYIIGSGYGLVLEPGAQVTLDQLTNSGDLKLKSDASNISSIITNNSINAIVELYLTGGGSISNYKWHYISTPVSTLPVTTFTGVTLDLATFAEPRVSTDLGQGWVAFDGYVYSGGGTDLAYDFTDLTPGKGYDYWDQLDQKFTFSGSLNVTNQAMVLSYSGTANSGFNLLGNPFSSGLNWNSILSSGTYPYPANTSQGIYFTRNKTQCTYIGGVGIPSDVTGIIPPMQGFFVKTSSTLNTINLDPAARTQTNIHSRYKGAAEVIPLVRLSLSEDTFADETVVRFDAQAKSDLDYEFDANKIFFSTSNVGIYSEMGGTKYAINGQPFPDPLVEIPIVVNLTKDGVHALTSTQLQGLDDYDVYLTDKTTGFTADLKTTSSVTFSASTGLITDRFVLKVGNITTGLENPIVTPDNIFNVYSGNNIINIQTISDDWDGESGSVRVLDLTGKTASDLQNVEYSKNSLVQVQAPVAKGIYIVELRSGLKRYVGKVIIR